MATELEYIIATSTTGDTLMYGLRRNVENVSFLQLYAERCAQTILTMEDLKRRKILGNITILSGESFVEYIKCYFLQQIKDYKIPIWWQRIILEDISKKDIKKLIKNQRVTPISLLAMMFFAEQNGFLFSEYEILKLPGATNIIDFREKYAFLDNFIDNSNTIFANLSRFFVRHSAKVLTKNNQWICLFFTDKGLNNEETYDTSHIHLVTNNFGRLLTWEKWLSNFQKGKDIAGTIHIDFEY